jgi:1,2-diacylglycerol 3-alpha-glucosyltransferase
MRVGIVSKWFNRGQPIVGRYVRSAVDELGHESFVLARPRREKGPRPGALERTGIWDQPRVTEASTFEVPLDDYLAWIDENGIEAILCDQNYGFAELAELRRRGVRTIGRFVWEHFTTEHLPAAREAYDVIYSVTRCEQERYASWGLETPRVPWGIHPELLQAAADARRPAPEPMAPGRDAKGPPGSDTDIVRLVFPGGFLGHRKPLEPVVEAFSRTSDPSLRLLVKAQVERNRLEAAMPLIEADERIELHLADEPWDEHLRRLAACDVCVTPSRWEGLGLPLYEAMAFGQPVITNDDPPMNEVIDDGVNGLLVPSDPDGTARSGIPARRVRSDALAAAIERVADPATRAELAAGAERRREELGWSRTVEALAELLDPP